jgi:hypothetical protein
VPDGFLLYFDDGDQSRACEVKWRTPKAIGVAFVRRSGV